jgi:hypothetical protein
LDAGVKKVIYEIKKLSFGELFGRAGSQYIDNFFALFTIAFIANLLIYIPRMLWPEIFVNTYINSFWMRLPAVLATGFSIRLLANRYLGLKQTIGEYLTGLQDRIVPIILYSFLQSVLVGIATLLLIIPGIILSTMLALGLFVLVVESKAVIESMGRSIDLTKGVRWGIFGFYLVYGILIFAAASLFSYFVNLPLEGEAGPAMHLINFFWEVIFGSLIGPYLTSFFLLLYFNQRIELDNFGVEYLIERFVSEEANSSENGTQ